MNGLNPKIFRQSCTFEVRLSNCFLTLEPLEVEMVTEEDYVLGHELATGLVQHIYNLSVWGGGPQTITVWIPKVSVAGLALTPSPSPPVSSLWLKDASEQRKMPGGGGGYYESSIHQNGPLGVFIGVPALSTRMCYAPTPYYHLLEQIQLCC